ncbi:diguanylate cyclase domain-containing protein [Methylopila henanensis]|uniref:Diguanylate cyclase domain-containing protein n=1 Tax=Methylopila henanensis TaxID=873516 RepID=A0ABW4K302_9HYPH
MPSGGVKRPGDTFSRTVIAPVSLLVAVMIVACIAAAVWVAQRQTADMQARERALAETALATRAAALEKTTNDYAHWDETYDRVAKQGDAEWFGENVVRPATDEYGAHLVAVVDGEGAVVLGSRDGAEISGPLAAILQGGFGVLAHRVGADGGVETASGLLLLDGAPALVALSRIRPYAEDRGAEPAEPRMLALVDLLGPAQLEALSKAYLLPGLRVAKAARHDASVRIPTADGKGAVAFAWRGSDPGAELLRSLLPIMLALLVAFAALTAYVLRQGKAAAIRLGESERRALLDPLTGLPNRLALFARVEGMIGSPRNDGFALAYLDLDGFKQVNDEHGHGLGDAVLKEAARRMSLALRDGDLLVRLGGDEFALLLPGLTDAGPLRQIAERVIAHVGEPIEIDGVTVRVGVTIGIAVSPADARDTLELVTIADAALYRAKRSAKGTVQFSLTA